jgi:predicted DNA-binding protein
MAARYASYSKGCLLSMTPEIHFKLKALAQKTGRTMRDLAREAITRLLADYRMLDIHAMSDNTIPDDTHNTY